MSTANFDDNKPGKVTIYDFILAPYPARLRLALHAKGLHDLVEFKVVNIGKGEHRTPEFKKLNYSASIPVLEFADGTTLSESVAITQYIDNIDNNPILTGKTPLEQGTIHMWTRKVEAEFLDPYIAYFHHSTPGLGPELETYQNNEYGLLQKERGIRGARYIDSILKTRPYIAGDSISMADFTIIAGFIIHSLIGSEIPEDCVTLKAWFEKVKTVPFVKAYYDSREKFLESMSK